MSDFDSDEDNLFFEVAVEMADQQNPNANAGGAGQGDNPEAPAAAAAAGGNDPPVVPPAAAAIDPQDGQGGNIQPNANIQQAVPPAAAAAAPVPQAVQGGNVAPNANAPPVAPAAAAAGAANVQPQAQVPAPPGAQPQGPPPAALPGAQPGAPPPPGAPQGPPPAAPPGGQPGAPPPPGAPGAAQPPQPGAAQPPPYQGPPVQLTNDQFDQLFGRRRQGKKAEAKLTTFTSTLASDWRDFRIRANNAKALNGWTDSEAKRMVLSVMEGAAGKRVKGVPLGGDPDAVPRPADAKTFEEYLSELQLRFQHREASSLAIAEFHRSRQRADEDFLPWHTRLSDIFQLAYPTKNPETDPDLIRQYILGLMDRVIADHLMDRDPKTYNDCLAWAQSKQGRMQQVRQNRNPAQGKRSGYSGDVNAINYDTGNAKRTTREQNRRLRRFGPNKRGGCEHCEKLDHETQDCPYIAHLRRHVKKGKKTSPRAPSGRGKRGGGRGRGGRGRGGKRNQRRGGAHAMGSDDESESDSGLPESLAAMEECLSHLMNEEN